MTQYLIIPGLGNSGEDHWQTHFENSGDNFRRIEQKEWDAPNCEDWIENINKVVGEYDPKNVVLVAHSLGCTAVAYWAKKHRTIIKGAFLVAPSDIENPVYTFPATGFTPIPLEKLPFPTLVIASLDDVWVSEKRAKFFAENWGSNLINIGNAGHINADAGFGDWPEGLEKLKILG